MNVLDLYRADGYAPRRVAATSGGEFAGPCPCCGGQDRFRIWPASGTHGRWLCRHHCGQNSRGGDAIQYLRDFRGLGYGDACRSLGIEPAMKTLSVNKSSTGLVWAPRHLTLPALAWSERASACVAWAEKQLWSDLGKRGLEHLTSRGLQEHSIRKARLGLVPESLWLERTAFGLPGELEEDGSQKQLCISAGVSIPTFVAGQVAALRVRQWEGGYRAVAGSAAATPMVIPGGPAAIVVESNLCAILVDQAAGDLVTTVALGSASTSPDQRTWSTLAKSEAVLISLDNDEAGRRAAKGSAWVARLGPLARLHPVPKGKDPTEYHQHGGDLRAWIAAGLAGVTPN